MDHSNNDSGDDIAQVPPEPSRAGSPFDNADMDADLILQTSDNVKFYVHKFILRKASPFFADMFSLPQADGVSSEESLPVVPIAETGSVLDSLLRICYPVNDGRMPSLIEARSVLEVASKYEIEKATTRMRLELQTYVSSKPHLVYAIACSFNLEHEAYLAADALFAKIMQKYLNVKIIGLYVYESDLRSASAGHFHRLLQYIQAKTTGAKRIKGKFCSPPPRHPATAEDGPLSLDTLKNQYTFLQFPKPDIILRSIDGANMPTHTSHLTFAGGHNLLNHSRERGKSEEGLPVIRIDEDARTLAPLLQLCYPFADQDLLQKNCTVFTVARARVAAEKYTMPKAVQVAKSLMAEQAKHNPVHVYFAASRYGWADEAEVAMNACMKLERIELEGANDAYTPEMEHVSAEVYFQLLKRHGDSGNSPLKRRRIGGRGWNDELWGYDI